MDLILFSHDVGYACAAVSAGVRRVVVDWEWRGKAERQCGWDTQINRATVRDLQAMHAAVGDRVICRVNNGAQVREDECRAAIDNGAGEVWLPMVRDAGEVEACLRALDGCARLGVMVETREAMALGRELAQLPLAHAYIGLHDYHIDGGSRQLFDPVVDGTLDRFRDDYPGAVGFAGVTRPCGGRPIPQRLLLAAMVRLGCAFGVARRGFLADIPSTELGSGIGEIGDALAALAARSAAEVERDHLALAQLLGHRVEMTPMLEAACAS